MRIFKLFVIALALTVFSANSITGQTEKTLNIKSTKVAQINSNAFDNGESGIKELAAAYDNLETELKPQMDELKILSATLQEKSKKLLQEYGGVREYDKLNKTQVEEYKRLRREAIEEYNRLFSEFEVKQSDYKSLWEKRNSEILIPVKEKISKALEQFKTEKGYALILDRAKAENQSVAANNDMPDVTVEFIKFYNDYFDKEKTQ